MNKYRRKDIEDLIKKLESIQEEIKTITDEEQEYYDNIPENLQMSEKAENSQNAISDLEDAECSVDDAISSLQSILQ